MIRSLVIIAVTGFIMSVVCISAAVAIGGPAIMNHGVWWMGPGGWGWDGHGHHWTSHLAFDDGDQPQATRKLAWTGEQLSVDLPADVRFTQADGPASLTIRGPQAAIDHVVVENGRIRLDGPVDLENLAIDVVAPKVTRFDVVGSGDLEIRDYRQDALVLNVMGSGDVAVQGAAKSVQTGISGSGDADLSNLAVEGADVRISGSGSATVGPRRWAKLDISGSGDITLTSRPPQLESHVSGSGDIQQRGGETVVPRSADAGPARPA